MTSRLVVATLIPWHKLTGRELEECLYWLLDSMGGKNLTWRKGGRGAGAADQGRDIEVEFFSPDRQGSMQGELWWVEAKGRSKDSTVPKAEVQSALLDAVAAGDVRRVVIATNTTFSNPTRDWVRRFAITHGLAAHLWDRIELERLLSSRPEVVARFFSEALSPDGHAELARSRFWNYAQYVREPILELIWKHKDSLEWTPEAFLAVIASEKANGSCGARPWLTGVPPESLLRLLAVGIANTGAFCFRANDVGTEQGPYFKAIAYILSASLLKTTPASVKETLNQAWGQSGRRAIPKASQALLLREFVGPVISVLQDDLRDVCSADCERVDVDPPGLSSSAISEYWRQFAPSSSDAPDERTLIIENTTKPCAVGFDVGRHRRCPLLEKTQPAIDMDRLDEALERFSRVLRARSTEPGRP